ncbi:multiple epidermal growth factor-like domains protein 10 [Ostrea edulis]|uniref:multiple epidermal growth factor-like domains protein 10 n=1 Tax=Ostrea edulis TaxID=37623 RepID=UPI0024AF6DD0|nr:multiple epidermal growth factor-like domains protein 10 [Ostrea edulis]
MTEYGGQASQSSTYPDHPWTADKAVDGYLQHDNNESTCSFTKDFTSPTAWWKFSLRKTANVAYLEIYFRNRSADRHVGFSVFVFDDLGFMPTSSSPNKVFTQGSSPCPTPVLNVTVNKAARGIALFNTKNPPVETNCEGYEQDKRFSTIETCEVNYTYVIKQCFNICYWLTGCPYAHFGENCSPCGLCQDGLCDVFNGSCIQGCSTHGMKPPFCILCQDGFYGSDCTLPCGQCRHGSHCNKTTGICTEGCQGKWSGTKCDVCGKGFYGKDCNRACGKCKQDYCDKDTGVCPNGCQRRWDGSRCNECVTGFFGFSCENPCGHCVQTTCTQESGHCLRGCQENWEGARCDARLMTSEPNTGTIGGDLFATLFALVGIIMLIVLLRYRNVRKRQRSTRSELNTGVTSELNSNHIQEGRRRDTSGNSPGAPSNVQIPNVDGSLECGYYNLAYRGTDIVIDELQRCIATKTTGQNNNFLAEYKVIDTESI